MKKTLEKKKNLFTKSILLRLIRRFVVFVYLSVINGFFGRLFTSYSSVEKSFDKSFLVKKIGKDSLLVLAGDVYQIESIDFGNWFFYAKEILPEKAIVELDNTWRTNEPTIKDLWEEVRFLRPKKEAI